MPTVWIPSLMRNLTAGVERVQVEGETMRQIVGRLDDLYPGFKARVCDEDGVRIRPNIAVMIDGRNTRMGLLEKVNDNSEIHFLPAISGGNAR